MTGKRPEMKAFRTYLRVSKKIPKFQGKVKGNHTNQRARDGVKLSQVPRGPLRGMHLSGSQVSEHLLEKKPR